MRRAARFVSNRAVPALVLPLLLTACAALPPARVAERVHQGRFSASAVWPDRQENVSGRFTLQLHADGLTLDLASALGNTLARIDTDSAGARMTAPRADGSLQRIEGADAETLAEQMLGWRLPVSGIGTWIAGKPVATRPFRTLPDETRSIEQDGWTIRVTERFEANGSPRRMIFERGASSTGAPAVTLRLVLDEARAS